MKETCENCVFYFKRLKELDPGVSVPEEVCALGKPLEKCEEYIPKWYRKREKNERTG